MTTLLSVKCISWSQMNVVVHRKAAANSRPDDVHPCTVYIYCQPLQLAHRFTVLCLDCMYSASEVTAFVIWAQYRIAHFIYLLGAVMHVAAECWTRDRQGAGSTLARSTASSIERVANLPCAQANSASYPQWDGKWVVAYLAWATMWRPSAADSDGGMSASCTVSPVIR